MTNILNAMKRVIAYRILSSLPRALPTSVIKPTGGHSSTTAAIIAYIVISTVVSASAAEAVTDAEIARLTQIQIDALETPDVSHQQLEISPDESEFSTFVKRMTSVVIDELKNRAVLMDFQPAEEIAKLIQQGAENILASNSSQKSIKEAESQIKNLADLIVTHGDHVIGSKSTIDTNDSGEVVQIHRSAFDLALRSFCPCWPFCH
jgi:hypothetical protein